MTCHLVRTVTYLLLGATALLGCGGGHGKGGLATEMCPAGPLFSVPVVDDFSSVGAITPLGTVNPPGHTFPDDHLIFYLVQTLTPPSDPSMQPTHVTPAVTIRAPATLAVIELSRDSAYDAQGNTLYTDYSISLQPCQQVTTYFGHLTALNPALLAQAGPLDCRQDMHGGVITGEHCGAYFPDPPVLQPGDVIGTAGGNDVAISFDWGAFDEREQPLVFANPQWFAGGRDETHVACPVDLYDDADQQLFDPHFGGYYPNYSGGTFVQRTAPPICGRIDQDLVGTVQGDWLEQGATDIGDWAANGALVHDNIDPTIAVLAFGDGGRANGPILESVDSPQHSGFVNREVSEVTADGNVYCYDVVSVQGSDRLLVQLVDAHTLQVEFQTNQTCAAGGFTFTAPRTYTR